MPECSRAGRPEQRRDDAEAEAEQGDRGRDEQDERGRGDLSGDGTHDCGVFWSHALGWPLVWDEGEETAVQSPSGGPKLTWGGAPLNPKPPKNRVHLDLVADDVATETTRLLGLGARPLDIGQGDVPWVVLADPDGNAFCVHPPPARSA